MLRDRAIAGTDAPTEEQLLAGTARGDRRAFQQLYILFHRRLARFLSRLTRQPELVQEIINETMFIVWQRAAAYRGESRASTWILGIAYRHALKTLTRESAPGAPFAPQTDTPEPPDVVALQGIAYRAELTDWLGAALAQLTPEHRMVIELAYVLDLSCEEIAQITGAPVNTVKTRMFHARKRLRTHLGALAAPNGSVPQKVAP